MSNYHLLEETKIPYNTLDQVYIRKSFKESCDDIIERYPRYNAFDYITVDNDDSTVSICLYGANI